MHVVVVGIDLGKNCCSVAGMDASGRVLFRKRVSRSGVVLLVRKHAGCVVAMEACCGAHHLGRVFAEAGHEVRLMSPEYVLRLSIATASVPSAHRPSSTACATSGLSSG